MRKTRSLLSLAVVLGLSVPASAGVAVNGDLTDWGITPGYNNTTSTSFTYSYSGTSNVLFGGQTGTGNTGDVFKFNYHLEDSNDSLGHSFQLGPQYGGQDYDAEFLGVGVDGANLVIAILSGQRYDNGTSGNEYYYSPGDIRISTVSNSKLYGVEVGGKFDGNGNLITGTGSGATWNLNSNGTTNKYTPLAADNGLVAGSIWGDTTWTSSNLTSPPTPVQLTGGTAVNNGSNVASYSFKNLSQSQHSIIELAIPLSWFGVNFATMDESFLVQWGPACANDLLQVGYNYEAPEQITQPVPEPSTLALIGLGGFGMMFRQWRRKTAAA